ncbi:MAG: hypothetical protein K6E96_05215 [Bacteroidales bacterium]|nr:hypothetical protein [Bacteroidales bacterium]
MKNIFKFLSIALMAGAMMVACGDDPVEPTDTTPDTPQPPAPQQASYKVTYPQGEAAWEPGANVFVDHTADNYMTIYTWKSADDYMVTQSPADIMLNGFMETVACTDATNESTDGDCMNLYDPTHLFHYDGDDQNEAGDYLKYSTSGLEATFVETVTSFDANTMRYNANWAQQYMDVEALATTGAQSYGEMSGVFTNFPIEWYSAN